MKRLERLTEGGGADPELARLFRVGRPPQALGPAAYERSRRRVLSLGAATAGVGVLAWVQHAALGAVLGTAVAVGAALPRLLTPAPAASGSVVPPPASGSVVPLTPPVPVPRASSAPSSPVASTSSTLSTPPRLTPAPSNSTLAPSSASGNEPAVLREARLLESARAELERRPAACLRLLAEHEREFPAGALAVERDFLVVAALLGVGQRARAEARAAALRARAPGSLYEQRLERLLEGSGTER